MMNTLENHPYREVAINSAFLEVPAEYQRRLQMSKVRQMVAEFNDIIVNPPKVSYRDGHYIVFDGQHTVMGLKTRNNNEDLPIVCRVYTGLTKEEEALLFAQQTGASTPLSAGAKLRAKLVGKDAESLAFLAATEAAGLQLGFDSSRAGRKIVCIRTAYKEYQERGADLYTEGLRVISEAWDGIPDSLRSGIIQGVMRFVSVYNGEYKYDRLVKRLRTTQPLKIVHDADAMSGPASYRYMMQILKLYNGCSKKNMLPMKFFNTIK